MPAPSKPQLSPPPMALSQVDLRASPIRLPFSTTTARTMRMIKRALRNKIRFTKLWRPSSKLRRLCFKDVAGGRVTEIGVGGPLTRKSTRDIWSSGTNDSSRIVRQKMQNPTRFAFREGVQLKLPPCNGLGVHYLNPFPSAKLTTHRGGLAERGMREHHSDNSSYDYSWTYNWTSLATKGLTITKIW